jgi:competence ComEA-like helix-hairpin-helix protein
MNRITSWFRNYFGFSQTEINGFVAMVIILFIVLGYTFFTKFFQTTNTYTPEIAAKDQAVLKQWVAEINEQQRIYNEQNPKPNYQNSNYQNNKNYSTNSENGDNSTNGNVTKYTLFAFNPNTATVEDLQKLGIVKFIAQRIVNYREKGGKFKVKSDLKKMYGFSEEKYDELENYIQLPYNQEFKDLNNQQNNQQTHQYITSSGNENTATKPAYIPKKPTQFDLNTADTAQLKSIRGIGTVLAERIVKYRNSVGGFHAAEQLSEIYGLQPEVITELLKYGVLNGNITKLNINTADEAKLKAHLYIGYKLAGVIIAYRNQHGNFKNSDDLLKIRLLDAAKIEKLKPYLEF